MTKSSKKNEKTEGKNLLNKKLSYAQVCEVFLDKQTLGGVQRNKQLARWQKKADVIKLEKERGKYVIKRFYTEEEKELNEGLINYLKYLEGTILNILAKDRDSMKNKKEEFYFNMFLPYTYRDFRERIKMVNNHYFPVKYNKESIDKEIKFKSNYGAKDFDNEKKIWFDIVESIDKNSIRKVLRKLEDRGLIQFIESYKFYDVKKKNEEKEHAPLPPKVASMEELSVIQGIQLNAVVNGVNSLSKNYTRYDELQTKKNNGELEISDLYRLPKIIQDECHQEILEYIGNKGYNVFGRCFLIQISEDINKNLRYFTPKFNAIQVKRFLTSKRFNVVTNLIHEQLVNLLIKSD